MGVLDPIVQLVLYACFGVYVVWGLAMIILGIVYMNDVGSVGTTGVWLCLLGFMMLVIGGIAIFANLKQWWWLLLVIELINVVLFLVLYVIIIVVILMASGTSDPVRRATEEGWDEMKKTLTHSVAGEQSFCESEVTVSKDCDTYFLQAASATDKCKLGEANSYTANQALNNCTVLDKTASGGGLAGTNYQTDCDALYPICKACEKACMEQTIEDVKDQLLPASVFVFVLTFFFVLVVVFNNIIMDKDEIEGMSMILGLSLNGILALLAFFFIIGGIWAAVDASDEENCKTDDCVPNSLILLIIIGVATLAVSVIAAVGIKLNNAMGILMLRITTLVMVLLVVLLILCGIILGVSSGAVMDDMNYYYDQNYHSLRSALERGESRTKDDPGYCQMTPAECTGLTLGTVASVAPKDEDGAAIPGDIRGSAPMTKNDVWLQQFAEAAKEASKDTAPVWTQPCKTTGICIYCDSLFSKMLNPGSVTSAAKEKAPSLNLFSALYGETCVSGTKQTKPSPAAYEPFDSSDETKMTVYDPTKSQLYTGSKCTAPATAGPNLPVKLEAGKGCGASPLIEATGKVNAAALQCTQGPVLPNYESTNLDLTNIADDSRVSAAWQAILYNYTIEAGQSNPITQYAGKCAAALADFTDEDTNCPDTIPDGTMVAEKLGDKISSVKVKESYVNDCIACKTPVITLPFSFTAGGSAAGVKPADDTQSQCLNYFVGHMYAECGVTKAKTGKTCRQVLQPATATTADKANVKFMVDAAYGEATTSKFCSYTDDACRAKIQNEVENSMTTIGVFGGIFLFFFLAIMFFTLQGIKIYKGGDDDDDDDDDDGDDE